MLWLRPQEECRAWDISSVVFSAGMWDMYQPMLRADFRLFDEYEHQQPGQGGGGAQPPFGFPLHAYWGARDGRVSRHMVQASGLLDCCCRQAAWERQQRRCTRVSSPLAAVCAGGPGGCVAVRLEGSAASPARRLPPQPWLQGWSRFTAGGFSLTEVQGNHLWPLDRTAKAQWLADIAARLAAPELARQLLHAA
jgi:hypothetical protein